MEVLEDRCNDPCHKQTGYQCCLTKTQLKLKLWSISIVFIFIFQYFNQLFCDVDHLTEIENWLRAWSPLGSEDCFCSDRSAGEAHLSGQVRKVKSCLLVIPLSSKAVDLQPETPAVLQIRRVCNRDSSPEWLYRFPQNLQCCQKNTVK